jgi:glycosyltransferase involved in cell wall biosynthesis
MAEVKKHMKVLMTADTVGGVWTYCMDLCRSLLAQDVQVHLITMGERLKNWQQEEVNALKNVVVYETGYKLEWMQSPWHDLQECGQWLLHLEEEIQPDLIHLNCFAYGSLPFKAPVMVVAHSDVWSWFLSVKGEEPPQEWKDYFQCVMDGLQGADSVIAPSNAKLNAIKSLYGITKGEVIYNGRDASLFYTERKNPSVFSMGRIWDEAKNIHLLMEAASNINAPVKIAGDNNFAQNNVAINNSRIDFLGKLSSTQIAAQLSTAAIYVLPAKYEPFGLSALEAALSGCALVLGDIPSLREIWHNAAIYVNTNSSKELASTVNALVQDTNFLQEQSQKAKAQAALYSMEAMTRNYIYQYRQMKKKTRKKTEQETV